MRFPTVDVRIQNLQAWLHEPRLAGGWTDAARARTEARIAALELLRHEVPQPLAALSPALDHWRRMVLATWQKRTPLELAAACELGALECEAYDDSLGAQMFRTQARQYIERAA